jgi:exopolysaccharide biosynthesis polyprenyl glycosylphosphotransferase
MELSHGSLTSHLVAQASSGPRAQPRLDIRTQHRRLAAALVVLDVLSLSAAFAAAYGLRFYSELPVFRDVIPDLNKYVPLTGAMLVAWLVLFALGGLYDVDNLLGGTREYALVFNACTMGTIMTVTVSFLHEAFVVSRGLVVINWLFTFLFAASARFWFRRLIYALRRRGYFLSPAVIVGANAEGFALAQQLEMWKASGMRLVGFVDEEMPVGSPVYNGLSVLCSFDTLPQAIEHVGIRELVVASAGVRRERMLELVQRYGSSPEINIQFSSGLFEILTTGVRVRERAYVPLMSLNKVRLTGLELVLKGVLDLVGAAFVLVLLSPLLAGLALWIKLDSPGPVLYRRRVLGLKGRTFDAFKFRTMDSNWEQSGESEEVQNQFVVGAKPKDDPRVTRAGRILRRFSLDELPQLFNVIKRDMSLVGPRMITEEEVRFYGKWLMNLLTLRPGITGLWQVSGRANVSYEKKVRLDMYYIRNYTIWLDLQILVRTLSAVFKGTGAY